jgi:hypothetical protein
MPADALQRRVKSFFRFVGAKLPCYLAEGFDLLWVFRLMDFDTPNVYCLKLYTGG